MYNTLKERYTINNSDNNSKKNNSVNNVGVEGKCDNDNLHLLDNASLSDKSGGSTRTEIVYAKPERNFIDCDGKYHNVDLAQQHEIYDYVYGNSGIRAKNDGDGELNKFYENDMKVDEVNKRDSQVRCDNWNGQDLYCQTGESVQDQLKTHYLDFEKSLTEANHSDNMSNQYMLNVYNQENNMNGGVNMEMGGLSGYDTAFGNDFTPLEMMDKA